MEVTNYCNFNCKFCPNGIMKRKRQFIETDLAFKVIDQIANDNISSRICFHLLGEPLLHQNIFVIVKYANTKKLYTSLFTNGGLLKEKIINKIFDAAPSELIISLQTPSKELFALRNSNMDYEKYEKQIKNVIEKHASLKSKMKISLEVGSSQRTFLERIFIGELEPTLLNKENFELLIKNWIDFGNSISKKYYGDRIQDKNIPKLHDLIKNYISQRKIAMICPNIEINFKRIQDWRGMRKGYKVIFGICKPNHFGILSNGDVVLCCHDYEGETKVGNVYQEQLMDILTSDKMKKIRKMMSFNIMPTQCCRRCKGYDTLRAMVFTQLKALYYIPFFILSKMKYEHS